MHARMCPLCCVWHNRTCWKLARRRQTANCVALKASEESCEPVQDGLTVRKPIGSSAVLDSETNRHYTTIEQAAALKNSPRIYFSFK